MKKVTISLPSIYPDKLRECIKNIEKTSKEIDYELIIVGPENIRQFVEVNNRTKMIIEKEQNGNAFAHQISLESSNGEYYVPFGDDVIPCENWLDKMVEFMQENDKISPLFGSFRVKDIQGNEMQQLSVSGKFLYPWIGCIKAETLKSIGGWSRGYHHYYSDPDVGMRVWKKGGKVLVCENAWIILSMDTKWTEKRRAACMEDEKRFYQYWENTIKCERFRHLEYWVKLGFIPDAIKVIKKSMKYILKKLN